MGLLRGLDFKRPNSLFTAIFASQPKKTTNKNTSSALTTTALPGIPPILNSGERSIEKIKIIKATSVFIKAIINTTNAKRKTAGDVMGGLEKIKNAITTRNSKGIIMARLVCPFLFIFRCIN